MTKICTGALLAFMVVGCGSDAPPGASTGLDIDLPDSSPLARTENVSLIRAGDSFILAGYDGSQVHWAQVATDGTLTPQPSFDFPPPVVGPVFAATMKVTTGDQLVALAIVNSATVSGGYDLAATVHTVGEAVPAPAVVLPASDSIPAGADPTTMELAAGAAAGGNVGYVAWGTRVHGKPIYYLQLPADAVTTASPSTFLGSPSAADAPDWDCLASQGRATGFSFGAVTPDLGSGASDFRTVEVDESGNTIEMTYQLTVSVVGCRIVGAPTPAGSYFMSFQGNENGSLGIGFATYYPPPDPSSPVGTVTTQPSVLPAVLFGGPVDLPSPAWTSSAGGDVVIGVSRKAGPQVFRFTYNAIKHGSTLTLRSASGNTGPVAAWVGDDGVYATYLDRVNANGTTTVKRYFMRVDAPASLP